jgi:phosphate transport system substrate-binding protein
VADDQAISTERDSQHYLIREGQMRGLAIILVVMALLAPQAFAQPELIKIGGAGLLSDLTLPLSEEFVAAGSSCKFALVPSTTGDGFKKWIAGQGQLVQATRKMTDQEIKEASAKGIEPSFRSIGVVPVAVVARADNPVESLTLEQLRKIFTGEITNWSEVGGPSEKIVVTTREVPKTGTGVVFQREVLKGAPYAAGHKVMSSYGTTVKVCSKSWAVGYIPTSTVFFKNPQKEGIKIIGIKKTDDGPPMKPLYGAAKQADYPVKTMFYYYWNAKSDVKCLADFAEFADKAVK